MLLVRDGVVGPDGISIDVDGVTSHRFQNVAALFESTTAYLYAAPQVIGNLCNRYNGIDVDIQMVQLPTPRLRRIAGGMINFAMLPVYNNVFSQIVSETSDGYRNLVKSVFGPLL